MEDRKESKWCENMCVSMFVEGKAVFMLTFARPSVFVFFLSLLVLGSETFCTHMRTHTVRRRK